MDITNAQEFVNMRNGVYQSQSYRLTQNIDLTGYDLSATMAQLTANFDGAGYVISGIRAEPRATAGVPYYRDLWYFLNFSGGISDVHIQDIRVSADNAVCVLRSVEGISQVSITDMRLRTSFVEPIYPINPFDDIKYGIFVCQSGKLAGTVTAGYITEVYLQGKITAQYTVCFDANQPPAGCMTNIRFIRAPAVDVIHGESMKSKVIMARNSYSTTSPIDTTACVFNNVYVGIGVIRESCSSRAGGGYSSSREIMSSALDVGESYTWEVWHNTGFYDTTRTQAAAQAAQDMGRSLTINTIDGITYEGEVLYPEAKALTTAQAKDADAIRAAGVYMCFDDSYCGSSGSYGVSIEGDLGDSRNILTYVCTSSGVLYGLNSVTSKQNHTATGTVGFHIEYICLRDSTQSAVYTKSGVNLSNIPQDVTLTTPISYAAGDKIIIFVVNDTDRKGASWGSSRVSLGFVRETVITPYYGSYTYASGLKTDDPNDPDIHPTMYAISPTINEGYPYIKGLYGISKPPEGYLFEHDGAFLNPVEAYTKEWNEQAGRFELKSRTMIEKHTQ